MISCITYKNMHKFGSAFSSQFSLRYQCFIERQKYNVSCYDGMEYDQYDTPAAVYLVYTSPSGDALGSSRLIPVSHRSMLLDLWPDMVSDHGQIFTKDVWEGTRFCIDKKLPPYIRQRICRELALSYLEFGLMSGAKKIIGVMPPAIFRRVFGRIGCDYDMIGPEKIIDGDIIRAAAMPISGEVLARARIAAGIAHRVLDTEGFAMEDRKKAA